MGLLDPVTRNRIRFTETDLSRSQVVSGRTPSNIAGQETAPYGWIDGYLRRICNRDCRPGALPLLGLGPLGLLNRLQRREILHQEPVSEDVTTTDFAQKDALGRVSRKPKLTAHQVEMARGLLESGKPPRDVAKAFGVGRSTLYRVLKLMDDSVMVASGAE
jgi:hypothetical protein